MTTSGPAVWTCPSWCQLPADHRWTDPDSADAYRIHRRTFGDFVTINQEQTLHGLEPARVYLVAEVDVAAEEAEQISRDLRAASGAASFNRQLCRASSG